jgi:hypothetical protein
MIVSRFKSGGCGEIYRVGSSVELEGLHGLLSRQAKGVRRGAEACRKRACSTHVAGLVYIALAPVGHRVALVSFGVFSETHWGRCIPPHRARVSPVGQMRSGTDHGRP